MGFDSGGHIIHGNAQLSHFFRVQPQANGIFRTIFTNGGYAFNTLYCVDKVRIGVCTQEHAIIGIIRRIQAKIHNGFSRFLSGGNTISTNLARHGAVGLGYTVLYLYRSDIGIFLQVELYIQCVLTITGADGAHIQHIFNAADLLLDSLSNGFFNYVGRSAYIVGFYGNTGLSNIWILSNRQAETGKGTQ